MIESTQVDEKCVIWDNATLHDKTSFKNSIIGPNVEVSSLSRIFNCILMKNVKIEERYVLCLDFTGSVSMHCIDQLWEKYN